VSYDPRNFLAGRATNVDKLPMYGCFSQMMRLPEGDLVIIAVGNVQATPAIDEVLVTNLLPCTNQYVFSIGPTELRHLPAVAVNLMASRRHRQ
jgi:hypothetical protein